MGYGTNIPVHKYIYTGTIYSLQLRVYPPGEDNDVSEPLVNICYAIPLLICTNTA